MPPKKNDKSNLILKIFSVCVVVIVSGIVLTFFVTSHSDKSQGRTNTVKIRRPVKPQRIIDYNELEQDSSLKRLMQKRKAKYGLKRGIDIITQSDELLKIGTSTVSMKQIEDLIRLKSGDIIEKDLRFGRKKPKNNLSVFGVYVVKPKDNIWNIHFKFLKDYFANKNITLSPLADEPLNGKKSSGIGKILKF